MMAWAAVSNLVNTFVMDLITDFDIQMVFSMPAFSCIQERPTNLGCQTGLSSRYEGGILGKS
jgi:hypothetical protein